MTKVITSVIVAPPMGMKEHKAFEGFLRRSGLSQSEAARRLGVEHMTVWRWVKGKVRPGHFAKLAIKERLGFDWPE